jgi:serine/threonine protein kinase
MAPEILNTDNKISYTKNIDVWSLGVLVYFLCCKNYPFIGSDPMSIYLNILHNI